MHVALGDGHDQNFMINVLNTRFAQVLADSAGLFGSALCALHCLALPAMVVFGTAIPAALLDDATFHSAMLWIIFPSALCAFSLGCWVHKDALVIMLGVIGLLGMALAVSVLHDVLGESGESIVTVTSAAVLIAAHYRNFRLCRQGCCDHG